MLNEMGFIIATFTAPENIGTSPASMLWLFPLLALIAVIYKATKTRVIFGWKFFREVVVLFGTLSLFMIAAAIVLHIATWLLTR